MRDCDLTSRDVAKLSSTTELMEKEWAPCRYNCPVHADVRTYIELAAQGRWLESIDVIRENLPFATVCGRICHHPCETNCRRNEVDAAVAIREVKRFVAEKVATDATITVPEKQDKAKVAIIGAGPSGMSAALELAKLGYQPTIFEKFPIAGGIPATAIPKYRMPREVIKIDTDWILAHGIELKTGVEIGRNKTINEILADGFEAVLIATGLPSSRTLPIPGADNPRVYGVMDFLTVLAFDEKIDIGKNVVVIGGGNVACDAARSAVRLGASGVKMMCLENEEEIPAWEWEVREAEEEGVEVVYRRGPVEIKTDSGKIVSMTAHKVTRVFDEDKRFSPEYDDSDVIDIKCDTIIFAIGQMADTQFIEGSDLKLDERGRVEFNPATQQTNVENIFACGEIVTPPGSVVEACANGQRTAQALDMFLSGQPIEFGDDIPVSIDKISSECAEKVIKVDRTKVPTDEPAERKTVFAEFEHNLDKEAAACEARRCMNCGSGAEVVIDKCAACLTCLRVCPFDIPVVSDVARIDSALCQACGMCIAECPANAIIARGRDKDILKTETKDAEYVAFICGHKATTTTWQEKAGVDGVTEFYLPSMARLSAADLLKAFENGAKAVAVVALDENSERYPQATQRIAKRVEQTRQMLAEVGIDAGNLKMLQVAGNGESIAEALKQFVDDCNKVAS